MNEDEAERLANRMALLASDSGEAEAAGRAVGQLAVRLGLTGGDLRDIVMRGAAQGTDNRALEDAYRAMRRERDKLLLEAARLRQALTRARAAAQLGKLLGAIGLVAVIAGGVYVWLGSSQAPSGAAVAGDMASGVVGLVHVDAALVYARADRNAALVTTLHGGDRVIVRRLIWNRLVQWAEIEVGGQVGYVPAADLHLM
ncbi:MAG: hypothetical protein KGK10_03865 [Rhodospirillales bacterium]|nr:hypothetical protein [Rhodospirillales bacterium]